ncbi:hypothetical protein P7H00_09610 [Enterococcus pseudoavium]|uniref:Uncharacterized protein n=1 Tax=Enterococcus pseudoavium TaxID=44007 RepID=A0AAE4I2L1_9ENTE|nr:hypothetical protein [Enterococcus pseudoavium]MDT2737383.1 hypothetical protein [Enterococcus pseudoavium]
MIALKSLRIRRNVLLGYWILMPVLFYFYLFLVSFNQQVTIQQLIFQLPGLTLALLLSFLMLFQAACLYFIGSQSDTHTFFEKRFLTFSLFQQVLTGNIIGAALCYFYNRNTFAENRPISSNIRVIFYFAIGFISLITAIILFIALRMKGV